MAEFRYIIKRIDYLSMLYNKPVRASYHDTYCDISVFTPRIIIVRFQYSMIKRANEHYKSQSTCDICNDGYEIVTVCNICENVNCVSCYFKIICANYQLRQHVCPHCRHITTFNESISVDSMIKAIRPSCIPLGDIDEIVRNVTSAYPVLFAK